MTGPFDGCSSVGLPSLPSFTIRGVEQNGTKGANRANLPLPLSSLFPHPDRGYLIRRMTQVRPSHMVVGLRSRDAGEMVRKGADTDQGGCLAVCPCYRLGGTRIRSVVHDEGEGKEYPVFVVCWSIRLCLLVGIRWLGPSWFLGFLSVDLDRIHDECQIGGRRSGFDQCVSVIR